MTLNDLKALQMSPCESNKLSEVIWSQASLSGAPRYSVIGISSVANKQTRQL